MFLLLLLFRIRKNEKAESILKKSDYYKLRCIFPLSLLFGENILVLGKLAGQPACPTH